MTSALKILSVGTIGSVMRELVPAYERASGSKAQVVLGNPMSLVDRLRGGEEADVVLISMSVWDPVVQTNTLDLATRTELATTAFAVAVRAGTPHHGLGYPDAFQTLMAQAESVGLVDRSPSTPILLAALKRLGIAAQVEGKIKTYATGEAIAEALAHRDVALGITTLSELLSVEGIEVLGPTPREIGIADSVTVAVLTQSTTLRQAASEFVDFLRSPAGQAVFAAKGLRPA